MPILPRPTYSAPLLLRNPHVHTVMAGKIGRASDPGYVRHRISTPDGDFLDLDELSGGFRRAAILLHGLEGSAQRPYMRTLARILHENGWDVVAVNFRGCSGEANRTPGSYHSGATADLEPVLDHVLQNHDKVVAIGFSLGGNLLLKYMGEQGAKARIERAMAVSVPCDLKGSSQVLATTENRLYMWNFLRLLREKVRVKTEMFPDLVSLDGYEEIRSFQEFDDRYTAPLHGFRDAEHYWAECSCIGYLDAIERPALLLTSLDDPFFSPSCYPTSIAEKHPDFRLEMTQTGGHVGFLQHTIPGVRPTYVEDRALSWLDGV